MAAHKVHALIFWVQVPASLFFFNYIIIDYVNNKIEKTFRSSCLNEWSFTHHSLPDLFYFVN